MSDNQTNNPFLFTFGADDKLVEPTNKDLLEQKILKTESSQGVRKSKLNHISHNILSRQSNSFRSKQRNVEKSKSPQFVLPPKIKLKEKMMSSIKSTVEEAKHNRNSLQNNKYHSCQKKRDQLLPQVFQFRRYSIRKKTQRLRTQVQSLNLKNVQKLSIQPYYDGELTLQNERKIKTLGFNLALHEKTLRKKNRKIYTRTHISDVESRIFNHIKDLRNLYQPQ